MSSSDWACGKILSWCFILRVSACLFSAGRASLSLSTARSLVSWVNACWPHSSLDTCQVERIESGSARIKDNTGMECWCGRCRDFLQLSKVIAISLCREKVYRTRWMKSVIERVVKWKGKRKTAGSRTCSAIDDTNAEYSMLCSVFFFLHFYLVIIHFNHSFLSTTLHFCFSSQVWWK